MVKNKGNFLGESARKTKLTILEITINHMQIFNPAKPKHLKITLK